ncbi:protein POLR1D-like isoform X1 [Bombus pyrosoma]|uniref:protein POLR1D-like isoform X1 n=2 Tax=Bombus pyrosoma TaxID=396416 RepID=UPI001CB8B7D1|nr:protein POLR1D-like isoform X1 [Bombus pyrosoma]
MDDETLNRLAVEALLEEAKIGAKRAEIMGPSGWIKPKESINKRFLHSTLRNVVLSNKYQLKRRSEKQLHISESTLKIKSFSIMKICHLVPIK